MLSYLSTQAAQYSPAYLHVPDAAEHAVSNIWRTILWVIYTTPLQLATSSRCEKSSTTASTDDAYLRKVIAAGDIDHYERTHLATLTATVKSKLGLPARPARRVVEYAFHAGNY